MSPADQAILRELRQFDVFVDVNPALMNLSNGVCMVPCADGDQFDDVYAHMKKFVLQQRETPRIHPLPQHGGALVISASSLLNRNSRGSNLLEDISAVPGMKEIYTVALYSHAPCAAADRANLSLLKQISLLKEADAMIQTQLPHLQALSFFQTDTGSAKKRTYFVSGVKWREWLQKNPNRQ
ncbi:MAG: hypothetical protein Q7K28_00545 [Candidatus Wildermuthbacteria bacterium]|nr:hypothetical protein [Candidatus Wildermuthbacteria bacterium]